MTLILLRLRFPIAILRTFSLSLRNDLLPFIYLLKIGCYINTNLSSLLKNLSLINNKLKPEPIIINLTPYHYNITKMSTYKDFL